MQMAPFSTGVRAVGQKAGGHAGAPGKSSRKATGIDITRHSGTALYSLHREPVSLISPLQRALQDGGVLLPLYRWGNCGSEKQGRGERTLGGLLTYSQGPELGVTYSQALWCGGKTREWKPQWKLLLLHSFLAVQPHAGHLTPLSLRGCI